MVSFTRPVAGTAPGAAFSFHTSPVLNSGNVFQINPRNCDPDLADRLSVHEAADCFKCLARIPQAIGRFFSHAYADVRMFFRAWSSMGGNTSTDDINNRVRELNLFAQTVEFGGEASRTNIVGHFERISLASRELLYYTDADYVQQFRTETSSVNIEDIRSEIVRECERAVQFQRLMTGVNTFYRVFTARFNPTAQTPGATPAAPGGAEPAGDDEEEANPFGGLNLNNIFGRAFGRNNGGEEEEEDPGVRRREPVGPPAAPAVAAGAIPGTIAYPQVAIPQNLMADFQREYRARVANPALPANPAIAPIQQFVVAQLPAEVRQRAQEIARLKQAYVANPGFPDDAFVDPIYAEIMEIPVFNTAHPDVQAALRVTPQPAVINRTNRHELDINTFVNQFLVARASGNRVQCAICRHPVTMNGDLPQSVAVDTELQIQTLNFLRARAAPAATTP